MLLAAIAEWPYGYYMLLRIAVCAAAAFAGFKAHELGKEAWTYVNGGIAVLFNPLLPIHLTRAIWAVIDVLAAGIMVVASFAVCGSKNSAPGANGG